MPIHRSHKDNSHSPAPLPCRQAEPASLQRFGDHIASSFLPNTVIVDATASEEPPKHYMEWLQSGIHIITPNKKLGSGPLDDYRQLRKFQRDSYIRQFQREFNIHFLYEVRVCLAVRPTAAWTAGAPAHFAVGIAHQHLHQGVQPHFLSEGRSVLC